MSKKLKTLYPKAFKSIQVSQPKNKYTEDEKYKFFVERKIVVPAPQKNRKKYDKKKERQKRYY